MSQQSPSQTLDARPSSLLRRALREIRYWFETPPTTSPVAERGQGVHWTRFIPLGFMHAGCLLVFLVGWSPVAVAVAAAFCLMRIFFVTAFYHRYFSHRAFKTSRAAQLVFAVLGGTCIQKGPLWWAAHHRHHHRNADQEDDLHSPVRSGFYWSHIGWLTARQNFSTQIDRVPDLARFPELRWLDRFDVIMVGGVAAFMWALGAGLDALAPGLGTSGWQMLVWGFFISTVVLYHNTNLVNSAAHLVGRKRFPARDESRNSLIIALLTFGEGWHNNHHYYPGSARQGFYWWEIDLTYYLLRLMAAAGIIWDLKEVPGNVLELGARKTAPRA